MKNGSEEEVILNMYRTPSYYENYTTEYGDTFDIIAFKFYYDEMLASEIMRANPDYCDVLVFDEVVPLRIPIFEEADIPDTLPPWRQ